MFGTTFGALTDVSYWGGKPGIVELDLGPEDQRSTWDNFSVEPVILCFVIGHYCDLVAVLSSIHCVYSQQNM